jgi:hypothetical protein
MVAAEDVSHPLASIGFAAEMIKLDCAVSILRGSFFSVRGYGLRTDEPRQGRNAATVV